MKIAVIIPAYNEGKRLGALLERMPKKIGEHEVIPLVVDDGSKDATSKVARSFENVRAIRHRTNLGKGGAAKTGCDAAYRLGADIFVLMDADLQHLPEDIGRMVEPVIQAGEPTLAIGTRQIGGEMPLMMRLGNLSLSLASRLLFGIPVRDTQSGFRAFPRALYPQIRWAACNYAMETEMLILATRQKARFAEVGISTIYLDGYKGTTALDGLRIFKTLLKWRLLWFQEYNLLEPYSAWS